MDVRSIMVVGEFRPISDPTYEHDPEILTHGILENDLLPLLRTKENIFMRFFQARLVQSTVEKDSHELLMEFAVEYGSWHYGWRGGRFKQGVCHEFHATVLERTTAMDSAGASGSTFLRSLGGFSTASFIVHSLRRKDSPAAARTLEKATKTNRNSDNKQFERHVVSVANPSIREIILDLALAKIRASKTSSTLPCPSPSSLSRGRSRWSTAMTQTELDQVPERSSFMAVGGGGRDGVQGAVDEAVARCRLQARPVRPACPTHAPLPHRSRAHRRFPARENHRAEEPHPAPHGSGSQAGCPRPQPHCSPSADILFQLCGYRTAT